MLKAASLLFVALPASALPAKTVDDVKPTARGLDFAPKPVPPVPDVVDDPAWLIATSGFCSNLNVVMKERDVAASETEDDTAAHFMADISFNYYPQTAVKFTDFPHHLAKTIEGDAAEAEALVSSAWDHKNIALLEPTSTCSPEQGDQAWGISVFKVEEHRPCADGETAWEGHPCVHYSGYVSAATSNFVNVNEGRFVCQLFVDSVKDWYYETKYPDAVCPVCTKAQDVKDGKKQCCLRRGSPCDTSGWSNDDDLCCSGSCEYDNTAKKYTCAYVQGKDPASGQCSSASTVS